jgi:hypothetical protein
MSLNLFIIPTTLYEILIKMLKKNAALKTLPYVNLASGEMLSSKKHMKKYVQMIMQTSLNISNLLRFFIINGL